ncbi:MAG: hypothetical protein ACETWQ_10710 [Phycisphaerae bacterium]
MGTNIDNNLRDTAKEEEDISIDTKEDSEFERSILHQGDLTLALHVIHLSAIHAIREFAVKEGFGVVVNRNYPLRPYEELANACRSALAATLRFPPVMFHCTISYCGGTTAGKPTGQRKVWNFAHSTIDCDRHLPLGPDEATTVGSNSSYAALLGCKDRRNEWKHRFRCFACDNLPEDIYDDADPDWRTWYRSRLVFPLRYPTYDRRGAPIDNITGFLSYDTLQTEIFGVPSIFDHMDDPGGYANQHKGLVVCNAGGIIADCIAIAILQEKKVRKYKAIAYQKRLAKEKLNGSKRE